MSEVVDLFERARADQGDGALWSTETDDLDCTLVGWSIGEGVVKSTNAEVDVVMIVIQGEIRVEVDGTPSELTSGQLILIEKGQERQVTALSDRVIYLNVHKRRRKLQIGSAIQYPRRSE